VRRAVGVLLFALAVVAAACAAPPTPPKELVVFAASSLTDAFNELGPTFPGGTVTFNYGATTQLRTQLEQGARADVFASANVPQMELAAQHGLVVGERPVFARNKLVVITSGTSLQRLEDLARPGLKLVITQRDVPVGVYTREALGKMSKDARFGPEYADRVLANVVSEEANVRQLVAKVQLGEADAAWVYATDAPNLRTVPVPDEFNTIAEYPVAQTKASVQPELAQQFVRHLLGTEGKAVLRKHGFVVD
jgi:molybdate transport system substrate-binding protein